MAALRQTIFYISPEVLALLLQHYASLGRAAALAGVPVGQMMTILTEYGVESRLEKDDYLLGLGSLRRLW